MATAKHRPHRSLTTSLLVMVAGSFAFGFALVPLYKVICEAAGIKVADKPAATHTTDAAAGRKVTLEFMSNLPEGSDFELVPETKELVLQPGHLYEAKFRIRNNATRAVVAQAVPSVAPITTAKYLQKTECFCFSPQSFRASEEREFVVRFIVNPDLPASVDRMTLAYSMYALPAQKVAAR